MIQKPITQEGLAARIRDLLDARLGCAGAANRERASRGRGSARRTPRAVGGSYGDGVPERFAEAAASFVRCPVDVIATYGTPAKALPPAFPDTVRELARTTGKVIVRRVRAALTQAESGDCLRLLESLGAR